MLNYCLNLGRSHVLKLFITTIAQVKNIKNIRNVILLRIQKQTTTHERAADLMVTLHDFILRIKTYRTALCGLKEL